MLKLFYYKSQYPVLYYRHYPVQQSIYRSHVYTPVMVQQDMSRDVILEDHLKKRMDNDLLQWSYPVPDLFSGFRAQNLTVPKEPNSAAGRVGY